MLTRTYWQVMISRHAMVNLEAIEVDCRRFERWPRAHDACTKLLHGRAPPADVYQWTLILLYFSTGLKQHQFHFTQVRAQKSSLHSTCRTLHHV